MADRTYKVRLTAGAHTWTVTDLDPPTAGLMDPLTVGWSMPDTQQRPTQPDILVASFSVVAATAADLDDLLLGDLVTIQVTFGPNDKPSPDVVFYGRIAEGEATPYGAGMLYRFTCADLTTDLNGFDIGADPFTVQTVTARMTSLLTRAGIDDTAVVRDQVVAAVDPNLNVEQVDQPNAANVLTSVIGLWDQVGLAGLNELAPVRYRAIIAPHPGAGAPSGIPYKWALDVIPDAYIASAAAPLPATFGHYFPDPQGYGLRIDPNDRAAAVIDACHVELGSTWAAIQPSVVNRAAVTWLTAAGADPAVNPRTQRVTYNNENPPPAGQSPVTSTRETQTVGTTTAQNTAAAANATRLGAMMVPPPQNLAGWAPDSFRWLLYKDQLGLKTFPVLFPHHDATSQPTPTVLRTAAYVRPVTVARVPGRWNAADATRDWIAGQITTILLTIENGRPVVDFQLAPTIPAQANPGTGTNNWNAQTGTWNAQTGTWNDKVPGRPAFRWADVSLVGVTWNQLQPQPWNMYRLARGTS